MDNSSQLREYNIYIYKYDEDAFEFLAKIEAVDKDEMLTKLWKKLGANNDTTVSAICTKAVEIKRRGNGTIRKKIRWSSNGVKLKNVSLFHWDRLPSDVRIRLTNGKLI